jgi:hypothetical protein
MTKFKTLLKKWKTSRQKAQMAKLVRQKQAMAFQKKKLAYLRQKASIEAKKAKIAAMRSKVREQRTQAMPKLFFGETQPGKAAQGQFGNPLANLNAMFSSSTPQRVIPRTQRSRKRKQQRIVVMRI